MANVKDIIVNGDARIVGNLYDNNPNVAFGTCTTAAATKDKVVTVDNPAWALQVGTIVGVKFSYTNTYSSQTSSPITLNVNNSGAKNIWYNTTHSGAGNTGQNINVYGYANRTNYYMYDGTYWVWMNMGVTDGNDISQIRQENGRVYAGTNGIARYSIIALDKDGKYQSLITLAATGTGTGKTINTGAKFKLNPILRWYNANNDATSGNLIANTYALYSVHASVDTRYSHNHTVTFATNTPLYIECTIDSDGYWSPTTVCITQTLRSGYYYIYLGESYSTEYQVSLATDHPVYYYDGTNLNDYMQKYVADHSSGGNISGSGTSGYLTKWNGTNSITNGPQLGSSTSTYLRNDGQWGTPANTTYTLSADTANNQIKLTPSSGSAQSVTVPFATQAEKLQSYKVERNNNSKIWFRIARFTLNQNYTYNALIAIRGTHSSNVTQNGILALHLNAGSSSGSVNSYSATFISASQDLDVNNFYIQYSSSEKEVWLLVKAADDNYESWEFIILQNHGCLFVTSGTPSSYDSVPTAYYTGKYATYDISDLAYISKGTGSSKFLREDGTWQIVSSGSSTDVQINGTSITSNNVANILTNSAYSSSNKIATMSDLPTNTDAKVAQTATTTSAAYELLFSETADNTTRTEGARKTSTLTYNPSTKALSTGGTVNGYTLAAASAKSVDTSISAGSSSANLPTSAAVASFVEGKGYAVILSGTQDPDSSLGNVGDIYIQLA